jgi:hypothetical protein
VRSGKTGLKIYGCSHWTVLPDIRLQTSSRNKSGRSASHQTGRDSAFCAGTTIRMLFSCKNRSREAPRNEDFLTLWKDAEVIWEKFKSDETPKFDVLGLVGHTHTAAPELLENAVVRDGLADERVRARHSDVILGARPEASQRRGTAVHTVRLLVHL